MAKRSYVPSPEELAARRNRLEQGLPATTESDAIALRTKISELEVKLQRQAAGLEARGPTPQALRKNLDSILDHYGVEPAEEILKIVMSKNDESQFILSPKERAEIWQRLMEYRMPRLRAVELSGKVEQNLTIKVVMFGETPQEEKVVSTKTIDISEKKQ